ncbi:MAG: cobalamin B12-binding domain-containing protein, partial [Limisphaerales bacterium]
SISTIASLSTAELRKISSQTNKAAPELKAAKGNAQLRLSKCIAAVKELNSAALEKILTQSAVEFGAQGLLQKIIAPLAQAIGELWRDGEITAAHEHFATAVIRAFLGHAVKSFAGTDGAPVVVAATPAGQLHELGAMLVGAAASNMGWNVTYLGASLPAAEIAGAAIVHHARAVALSIVYPEDDARLESELTLLRELLPADVPMLVGGRAMPAYQKLLEKIGALEIDDLNHLCATLEQLRRTGRKVNR